MIKDILLKWSELSIRTPPEFVEPLSEFFRRYGHGGVVIEDQSNRELDADDDPVGQQELVVVCTYLPRDATYRRRKGMIEAAVRLVAVLHPMEELQEKYLKDDDWEAAWKSHFSLLRVGSRLVIRPSWQEYTPREGQTVVVLDPGLAFGTGHHPTTFKCLEQLEEHVTPEMLVLDVGTGSGILAVAALKLGAAKVIALDLDQDAVKSARSNLKANGMSRRATVVHGTLPHPEAASGKFDIVVANLTATAIVSVAGPLVDCLVHNGILILSGILQKQLQEVRNSLIPFGVTERETRSDGDWVTLTVVRNQI